MKIPEWMAPVAPVGKLNHGINRNLGEDYESYLVDSNGNQYEPYSMAWRYLGAYIDCDIQQKSGDDYGESNIYRKLTTQLFGSKRAQNSNRRGLGSGSGDGDDCSRKVLWAAYYDPHYRGNEIGEYQFYDHITSTWDKTTCQTARCAKMNCHASRSHFQLIGVFKETDGFTDWAEQLFKHEGYCIWDGDKEEGSGSGDGDGSSSDYEFMSNRQDYIPQGCNQMYLEDDDGNTVYRGLTPLTGGNITESLYIDEDCTQRSTMSFANYIVKWYTNYYYDEDKGIQVAESWMANTIRWNDLMMDYHVCQPCRAYNKVPTYEDEDRFRRLDEDDGGGDEEKWGYNCYDDAGYRNCNQCYKFETKTDMEPASTEDLERASKQGTILAIKVDGVTYGKGGIDWHDVEMEIQATLWIIATAAVLGIVYLFDRRYRKSVHLRRQFQKSLRVDFLDDATHASTPEESPWAQEKEDELARNRRIIEDQRRELEEMKLELDQEHAIRGMEWEMNHQYLRAKAEKKNKKKKVEFLPESDGEGRVEDQQAEQKSAIFTTEQIPPSLEPELSGFELNRTDCEVEERKNDKSESEGIEVEPPREGSPELFAAEQDERTEELEKMQAKEEEDNEPMQDTHDEKPLETIVPEQIDAAEEVETNQTNAQDDQPQDDQLHDDEQDTTNEIAPERLMVIPSKSDEEIEITYTGEIELPTQSLENEESNHGGDQSESFEDEF